MWRWIRWTLVIIGTPLALAIGLLAANYMMFSAPLPEPKAADATDVAGMRAQDLAYLRVQIDRDRSYSKEEAAAALEAVADLESRATELTDDEFAVAVMSVAAIADNPHTNMMLDWAADGAGSLPVRFFWFEEGLFVVRARTAQADLVEARVVAIDGRSPESLLEVLAGFYGGPEAFVEFRSPWFFASPGLMHAAGAAESPNRVTLDLSFPDGRAGSVALDAEEAPTPTTDVAFHPLDGPVEQALLEIGDWTWLRQPTTPLSYFGRDPVQRIWVDELPGDGRYVRIRQVRGTTEPLVKLLDRMSAEFTNDPTSYLVVDLRTNQGGNSLSTVGFSKKVKRYVDDGGRIYLLVDNGTYSAAIITAAYLKIYGGDQVSLVGEPMGDRGAFWAEGPGAIRLPHSGFLLPVTTGFHDWENGCLDMSKCFWPNIVTTQGAGAGPLDIDVPVALTFRDHAAGRDTVMAKVFELEGVSVE